jgi:uncharacterized membrane protein
MLQKKKQPKKQASLNSYMKYSGIAFQMIVIILIGVFGGMKLDKWLKPRLPIFTAVLSAVAVVIAIYFSIKELIRIK